MLGCLWKRLFHVIGDADVSLGVDVSWFERDDLLVLHDGKVGLSTLQVSLCLLRNLGYVIFLRACLPRKLLDTKHRERNNHQINAA